jgi:hypothetical protein
MDKMMSSISSLTQEEFDKFIVDHGLSDTGKSYKLRSEIKIYKNSSVYALVSDHYSDKFNRRIYSVSIFDENTKDEKLKEIIRCSRN